LYFLIFIIINFKIFLLTPLMYPEDGQKEEEHVQEIEGYELFIFFPSLAPPFCYFIFIFIFIFCFLFRFSLIYLYFTI
jgi:hypothetical protein